MRIEEIDVHGEAMRPVYEVMRRAELQGREGSPVESFREVAAMFRHPDSGERAVVLAGYDDADAETVVAVAFVWFPLMDNLEKSWFFLGVDPEHQHRGHGRALLAHVLAMVDAEGRTTPLVETVVPFGGEGHRHVMFARAAGFDIAQREVVRHLTLPVPDEAVAGWIAESAAHHDCRVETFVDDVPPELLESYLVLRGQLAVDAPSGTVDFEEEQITPERFAELRDSIRAGGRAAYETLAITPDGVVAAHSTVVVPLHGGTDAQQWGTFVHREHRGRRLGLAVKAASLRAVQAAHPTLRRIVTENAEDNPWMIAVNEKMGFEAVESGLELVRRA